MKKRLVLILIFSFVVVGCATQISEVEPTTTSSPVPAPGFEDVPEMIVKEEFVEDDVEHEIEQPREVRQDDFRRYGDSIIIHESDEMDIIFNWPAQNQNIKTEESEIYIYNKGNQDVEIDNAFMDFFVDESKVIIKSLSWEVTPLDSWERINENNQWDSPANKIKILNENQKGKIHYHYFTEGQKGIKQQQRMKIVISVDIDGRKSTIEKELKRTFTPKEDFFTGEYEEDQPSTEKQVEEEEYIEVKSEKIYRIEIPTEEEKKQLPECDNKFFTTFPVDMNEVESITPLGNLGPPGHTFPTQHPHIHLGVYETSYAYPLYAPADVYITSVAWQEGSTQDPVDYVIYFALCKDVIGYYNHVKTLSNEVKDIIDKVECEDFTTKTEGSCTKVLLDKVEEGTLLGEVGLKQGNFDFGLIDLRKPLDFIKQERYPTRDQYLNCAFDYYPENMKQQFYGLINRVDGTCGQVMQDVPNTLKGNWFHESSPAKYVVDWNVYLAFVDHYQDPSIQVVSIAGIFTGPSLFKFIPKTSGTTNREFSQVTADGNIYCYEGANLIIEFEEVPSGKILVEMTGDETLQIEHQSGSCTGSESFKNPEIYNR